MRVKSKSLLSAYFLVSIATMGTSRLEAQERRYTIHTSGLNSSVYVNMLYFANLVNQHARDFTLITLPSDGGPSNMISVNEGRASFGTSTAESVKEAFDCTGDFAGRNHVA